MKEFILASASPRRSRFLQDLGLNFRVVPADLDEDKLTAPFLIPDSQFSIWTPCLRYRLSGTRSGSYSSPSLLNSKSPASLAEKLAFAKAAQVAKKEPYLPVLGADTIVALGQEILGKPSDVKDAESILQELQGKKHRVYTGVALLENSSKKIRVAHEVTDVWMRPLSPTEIKTYVDTGESFDKAGAYAIQGRGGFLIEKISGCYTNVVGLPLPLTLKLLREWESGK